MDPNISIGQAGGNVPIVNGEKMGRQLMNVFFKRDELVDSTISKHPKPGKRKLNPELIDAIASKYDQYFKFIHH